jgi:phosphotransferase system HPr (HPr) family protein
MKKKFKMKWQYGLHARPTMAIREKVRTMDLREVLIVYKGMKEPLNGGVMNLMLLGIGPGQEFEIIVSGPDEKKAFDFLNEVFSSEEEPAWS